MGKYSRVKKNTDIYDKLSEGDNQESMIDSSMKDYARRKNESDTPETLYQANRRKISVPTETQPFEKPTEEIIKDKDLLSEFIEEVKEYNIQRGLRKVNDTQVNILKNLGKIDEYHESHPDEELTFDDLESPSFVSTLKDEMYQNENDDSLVKITPEDEETLSEDIETIMNALPDEPYGSEAYLEKTQELEVIHDDIEVSDTDKVIKSFDDKIEQIEEEDYVDDISKSLDHLNLSSEDDILVNTSQYDTDDFYETITEEIEVQNETVDVPVDGDKHQIKLKKEREDELIELTQTLSLQLNDYEEELDSMQNKVSSLDKILTIFVFVLILILISIIGVVVYWIVSKKGII